MVGESDGSAEENGKMRVCIDFTDLNKVCPKVSFPFPHIDRMVDATVGHELLSFLDAFYGYNQILMQDEDWSKIAFNIDEGVFCYKVMSFGLKNARATYQRMMNEVFKDQIRRNLEVYVDDMFIKSRSLDDHLVDLKENFIMMQIKKVRINLIKYVFRVMSGNFQGFMLTKRGIEVNLTKCKVIPKMRSLTNVNEV